MKKVFVWLLPVLAGALFMACESDNGPGPQGSGTVVVKLTDAPFPFEWVAEANVTVFKIDARLAEPLEDEEDSEVAGDGSPFVVLMEEEISVNLLELTNGLTAELADIDVPAGNYDLVRVYVKGVDVVLTDGTRYDLKVPSGEQTGIKIFIQPELVVNAGLTTDVLLDFDVSRSFIAKGNISSPGGITGFNFKPVIKATNNTVAGTLSGRVSTMGQDETATGLEGVEVAVYAADTLNTTTFTDADGNYAVLGLLAGTYDVEATQEGYEPGFADAIEIVAGNATTVDFELAPLEEAIENP